MNKLVGLSLVVIAFAGCKKSKTEPTPTEQGSAPAVAPADASAPATADAAAPAVDAPAAPSAAIQFDALPDGWARADEPDGGTLEIYEAVNDSKFPVDNARYAFGFGAAPEGAPTDPAQYGAWYAGENKSKVLKTETIGDGTYYLFSGAPGGDGDQEWQIVKKLGDKLYECGGSMYEAGDYKSIKKVSAPIVETAKKLCASMKL